MQLVFDCVVVDDDVVHHYFAKAASQVVESAYDLEWFTLVQDRE